MSFLTTNDIIQLIRGSILEDYDIRPRNDGDEVLYIKFRNGELKVVLPMITDELKQLLMVASP